MAVFLSQGFCFINTQELDRIFVRNIIFACQKNFTYSRREDVSGVIGVIARFKFLLAAILASCGCPQVAVMSIATSGAILNGISGAMRRVSTSDDRRISQAKLNINNVYQIICRPRARTNGRRRRSATRASSTSGVGGKAADGDGSSSDGNGLGHRVPNSLSYFLKSNKVNFTNRFLHPYSLRAYGSIYVRCCQRLGMVVA